MLEIFVKFSYRKIDACQENINDASSMRWNEGSVDLSRQNIQREFKVQRIRFK
jgi:hypothetical protein